MHMLLTLWTPDNLHAAGIFREGLSSGSASGANRSSSARSSAASSARSSSSAANSGTSSHTRSCGICQIHSSVWWREWESESDATWKIQITPIELASSLQLCVSDRVVGWQCGAWALWRPQLPYLLQMSNFTRLFLECTSCFYKRIISNSCGSFEIFCLLFSIAAEAYDLNAAHCSEWQMQNIFAKWHFTDHLSF